MRKNGSSTKDIPGSNALINSLTRLYQDHETAKAKYELILQKAREYFESKGWPESEHLVNESIAQFNERLSKISTPEISDLLATFTATAKKVLKQYLRYWVKTPDALKRLLTWLDPDESKGAEKYREIHSKLTALFISYGFANAEDLADDTIIRVMKKLPEIQPFYKGPPELYFSGVAKNIRLEQNRFAQKHQNNLDDNSLQRGVPKQEESTLSGADSFHECLEKCLAELQPKDRELILTYYEEDDYKRVELRKDLAQKLGISQINLRVRKHRTMQALEKCIKSCLKLRHSANPQPLNHSKADRRQGGLWKKKRS